MENAFKGLNDFPAQNGNSTTLSLKTFITYYRATTITDFGKE
jgi:hypothetical protein